MYFQIENTPEHIKRARKPLKTPESPKEECPRLILAPFSRPPQVVFENVPVGSACERHLEVYNPSNQLQQITLGRGLPPGLHVHLPTEWLTVEPETVYTVTLSWTPLQPTALRETLRFTTESRGRFDVIVVLKSASVITKGKKRAQPKSFKVSPPGKIKKKTHKTSPVAIYKKKSESIYSKKISHDFIQPEMNFKSSNKENIPAIVVTDQSMGSYATKCPFADSVDFTFNTSEIFSTIRKTSDNILQNTFDKSYNFNNAVTPVQVKEKKNVSGSEMFDNLTFTPLKTMKTDKLEKGPTTVVSVNSESELDDSLNDKKDNETRSIIRTPSEAPNKWITALHREKFQLQIQNDTQSLETVAQSKKIPNTSSPKEMCSPNFSINTDFSRISELSFFPQRFSTERKVLPKFPYDNRDLHEDPYDPNSDTFTKESPNTQGDQVHHILERPQNAFLREQPKSRQALFKEIFPPREARNYYNYNHYEPLPSPWQNEVRPDLKTQSPKRSPTPPPLQSIPEESTQMSNTQILDKTDKITSTFTINKTFDFDKLPERYAISSKKRQTWNKTAIRVEPELWKIPASVPRKSLKPKPSTERESISTKMSATFDTTGRFSITSQIGDVYSQAATVDPFSSATYFYDEEAVHKFETEFKRWLNCILTPPADLESNVEQKIDVGKAWIENRNKEVPLAPTKEQVCSKYHDSQRLAKLRRAAATMLRTPEYVLVIQKLNAQIEKKLIAIRTDRNLHLDIGLQKIIMEILLSYNPLWLRIGLEAIYGVVLPLKSNSDVEGLTTFIIQRMFKNPFLKNKHSKSNAPNMLLPAYMEALKKYTLKKFFILVFFLDQAKEKKLIPHDPCLFCRNAVCKESREIIIRFTRELIAGIGDITKHLRPLGYVVKHKQSYLDEYKYAVHNLALDIRDGVRLTKVMEIILMKDGFMKQLRTPAISRLQKIHNVQVALNALKEANFEIAGEITAHDIADGHREKTLSLLWQLIHEFRAPLFQQAANVIQAWWRKKYLVIVEKRLQEEVERRRQNHSVKVIQNWWRTILYNRMIDELRRKYTTATIIIQKYWRMALCRNHYRKTKACVSKIEQWYLSLKHMRLAKLTLEHLKMERKKLRHKSAVKIQAHIRRWTCVKKFKQTIQKVIIVQSIVRSYLIRQSYLRLKKAVLTIQERFRGKLLMRQEIEKLALARHSATVIKSWYKMLKQRKTFLQLKKSVKVIEERYMALLKMRKELEKYRQIKQSVVLLQARFRGNKCRQEASKKRNAIVTIQRKLRAHLLMKKERMEYLLKRNATVTLQRRIRSYLLTKKTRQEYLKQRQAATVIQIHYRSYKLMTQQRTTYLKLRSAAINLQIRYRSLLTMRREKSAFLKKKQAAIILQRQYRAQILMKYHRKEYKKLKKAAIAIQQRYRAQIAMRSERYNYLTMRSACKTMQTVYKARVLGRKTRQQFLAKKQSAIKIQNWFRNCRKGKVIKENYQETKKACVTIQRVYRAYIIGKKQRQQYIKIRTATIRIQNYYRSYVQMNTVRNQYIKLKEATVTIQKHYRSHLEGKKQRKEYLKIKNATETIQKYFRSYIEMKTVRQQYIKLKTSTVILQKRYRSLCLMRRVRQQYLTLRKSTITIQQKYRALIAMRLQKQQYLKLKSATVTIQTRFRAQSLMKKERQSYITLRNAIITIQTHYLAYKLGLKERQKYIQLKKSVIVFQQRYKALITMRKERQSYLKMRSAAIDLQRRFRARKMMLKEKNKYATIKNATVVIQRAYKAFVLGRKQRQEYLRMKSAAILIQTWIRNLTESRRIRIEFLELKNAAIFVQHRCKSILMAREQRRIKTAVKIQKWYRSVQKRNQTRNEFLTLRKSAVILQSIVRMRLMRKTYIQKRQSAVVIQNFYRSYKLTNRTRQEYLHMRICVIKIQSLVRMKIQRRRYIKLRTAVSTIQTAFRLQKQREETRKTRELAAICIQKNVRKYIAQARYEKIRSKTIFLQKLWRGKLVTRLLRCEYLQKRRVLIQIQSVMRGYLARKSVEVMRKQMIIDREEKRRHKAATVIQAYFRGHKVRTRAADAKRVAHLRQRWRQGALKSNQESLKERHEDAMDVLRNVYGIECVIRAFKSLELLTEVLPTMYMSNAPEVSRAVHICMSVTNRSISSVDMLKSAAAVLVNLTRFPHTGVHIYDRDHTSRILKFMFRFSSSEPDLITILCTHLWLFHKYPLAKDDLIEYFHIPETHKMMCTIKNNVERIKRMANNARSKFSQKPDKSGLNFSLSSNKGDGMVLPALDPDYGITRADKPKYFKSAVEAMNCLFKTYRL